MRPLAARAAAGALCCLLAAPGLDSCQAFAAVMAQRQAGAAPAAGAQAGALAAPGAPATRSLSPSWGSIELKASLDLPASPSVQLRAPQMPLAGTMASAWAPLLSAAPASLPGPVDAPAVGAPSALEQLGRGAALLAEPSAKTRAPESQKLSLDETFQGRGVQAAAGDADALVPEPGGSGMVHPSALRRAGPRGPPSAPAAAEPPPLRQSLARSLRVGWIAAVIPAVLTVACQSLAPKLGYILHPSYQGMAAADPSFAGAAVLVAMASVMAPVAEEMIFRKGLMGGLGRLLRRVPRLGGVWLPALASSAAFVALHEHSDPLLFSVRLVHALILSRVFHKEGLATSISAHVFFNGLLTLPMLLAFLPGPFAVTAEVLLLPASLVLAWRAFRALKAAGAGPAAPSVKSVQLTAWASLGLAVLLVLGFFFLAPNPIWLLGAAGYAWDAARGFSPKKKDPA